jgi:rhamnulokinase
MADQVYLGIDLGAESGRVMAGRWDGALLTLEELHRFPNGPISLAGTLRWDSPRLWQEIQQGLGVAARRFGDRIVSVGVDTWGLDYVLLSQSGELLGLPFCYRDARTRGRLAATLQQVPRADIFAATGAQFLEINTLYQWQAHFATSPEVFAGASTSLMMPDWLNWCLCGSRVAEFTNATTTQFCDPMRRTWAVELLRRLGLPTHCLPELVPPGTRVGELRASVSELTGLRRIPVIAPATHDTGSAVAAVPTAHSGRTDWAYISSGTWSLVGIESPAPLLSPRALELNVTNEGGVDGTWRVLKNVMGLWLVQRCRHAFAQRGGTDDYARLTALAEAATPLRSFVDPDDPRFLNPADMPAEIQAYCRETNQPVPGDAGALIRCVLESLALKYAAVLKQLEELGGETIRVVHVVGGGSRNRLLNQLTADACQLRVLSGPVEATVMGNVLVQAKALGELGSLGQLREVVRRSEDVIRFEPRPNASALWAEARSRFARLLASPAA